MEKHQVHLDVHKVLNRAANAGSTTSFLGTEKPLSTANIVKDTQVSGSVPVSVFNRIRTCFPTK
jgi:hypothetical protein